MKGIYIRPMRAEEKRDVGAIMRRSFELTQQLFFSWSSDVLVAEQDGKLLGAVVLKMFPLPGDRKGGLIAWVFTAPEARGTGAGQRLIEAALKFLEEQDCDELMACVEGYNSSSSKLFATRGFSIRYYSGSPQHSTRDEGGVSQSVMKGINHVQSVFADRRDVAADGTEGFSTRAGAKRA